MTGLGGLSLAGFTILFSYLIGAIPFGYLVGRWRGVDIFKVGSGNIGATNVGRVLGRRFGILVFLLDFAKGAMPAAVAMGLRETLTDADHWLTTALPVLAGLSAFVGHLFPVYLRFRGGKGVATGAGVVAVLLPVPALIGLLTWIFVVGITRYVSLASLSAGVALCFSHIALTADPCGPDNWALTSFAFLAVGLVFARHHANIKRLLQGNENRLPESTLMKQIPKTLHVLAMGLWFGSTVFFLIVAGIVFKTFESLGSSADRPSWVAWPAGFDKEMGTRMAGVALAPVFDSYFPLQIICGYIALSTAFAMSRAEPALRVHRLRNLIVLLALTSVVIGWLLADYTAVLRIERYSAIQSEADYAKSAFAAWHGVSLTINMITIILVAVALALAAQMPAIVSNQKGPGEGETLTDRGQKSEVGNQKSEVLPLRP
jgi:acyl-phosphate glycerol 3-phosphate acyltransferase